MCTRDDVTVVRTLRGERSVDSCIAPLVATLNEHGIETIASCCGHGIRPGIISLTDGRELIMARDFDEARRIDALFEPLSR